MVNDGRPAVGGRHRAPAPRRRIVAPVLLGGLAVVSLAGGVAGGLWRLGVALPDPLSFDRAGQVLLVHAALMICGFLGTVIGIERAVAVKHRAAFLAPLASGSGALCLALGQQALGAWLGVAAALVFLAVNAAIVRRQTAAHTLLLLAAAAAWVAGSLLFALAQDGNAVFPWWFAFLIMTIAAERLEMTRLIGVPSPSAAALFDLGAARRLMRQRPAAHLMLHAVLALLLTGAAWSGWAPRAGGVVYGTALVLLAAWLASFDVARRTVFTHGLSRYMAICLLGGYAWLAVAGVAWAAMALGAPTRDAALHALGLGFVFSMMMGHAPVVLPSITRVKLRFGAFFYLPLAALHLSLLVRLALGTFGEPLRAAGASLNAAAIGFFAATVAGAAVAWRLQHGAAGAGKSR